VNGRQSITMNGHVAYEIGNGSNGNAPESIEALAAIELPAIPELALDAYKANKTLWLELELRNEDERPIRNTACVITDPDGVEYPCRTDEDGVARIEGISHLSGYRVTFPAVPTPSRISVGQSTSAPNAKIINLVLKQSDGQPLAKTRTVLTIDEQSQERFTDANGRIRQVVSGTEANEGRLDIYLDTSSDTPTQSMRVQLSSLENIASIKGVQTRCNHLGYDCGTIDGDLGEKTQRAIQAFQSAHNLPASGQPDEATLNKLTQLHGG
ncbi:MAG: peptidoglycan-binding domain-containing protein, partial [Reinekea sp.]